MSLWNASCANTAPDALNAATLAPGVYVEVRDPQGKTIGQAIAGRGFGGKATIPRLPAKLIGFRQPTGRQLEASTTFTAGSVEPGGPQYKVSAWQLADGDQLILALPLDEPAGTLHRLLLIEAAVTAVAVAGWSRPIGWWAVRVGLRPLVDMENTATAIAGGDLDRRVPGDAARTEMGRLARALNAMLARIHGAFDERDATERALRVSRSPTPPLRR